MKMDEWVISVIILLMFVMAYLMMMTMGAR